MTFKSFNIPIAFSISVIIAGMYCKTMHWLYGNEIIVSGYFALVICYLIRFYSKPVKKLLDVTKVMLVKVYCITAVLQTLHYPYPQFMDYLSLFLIIVWVIQEIIFYYHHSKWSFSTELSKSYLLMAGLAAAILGVMFKIQHWPGATPMLSVAAILLIIAIMYNAIARYNESKN